MNKKSRPLCNFIKRRRYLILLPFIHSWKYQIIRFIKRGNTIGNIYLKKNEFEKCIENKILN